MFGMGHIEILIIFLIILLIFGAKRIPEMAQGLGKGIREFRTAMRDVQEEIDINAPASNNAQKGNIETAPATGSVAQNAPNNTGDSRTEQGTEKSAGNQA
ncbi:MAG: twin-arginine translocase TatA/TatE family subunit [Candidatus Latescibacterota bacterium]|nr:twin-arginine translocase TatA/TatE family subunit [Candidatus Latescibacterota bacterium]MEC8646848.1 twin-arginine translocase TatA/TatE family subunit [Candidatus Latescibacterota bacterium]MEE2628150.1 twin-arginine translocase TatA/TatE family subunit [Candidatus Latescibacterota bacterium]MEE2725775.1 twin-arginine translocase TatA/TatE family subunit [Candidatus Latescibacterota bacterium]